MIQAWLSLCKVRFIGGNKYKQISSSVNTSDFYLSGKKYLYTYMEKRIHEHCLDGCVRGKSRSSSNYSIQVSQ